MAMNKDEFRDTLSRCGYTVKEFADMWGVSEDTVWRWGRERAVPRWVLALIGVIDRYGRSQVEIFGRGATD